jgi:hypothetical protein
MPSLCGNPPTKEIEDRSVKTVGLMLPNSLESTKALQKVQRQLFEFT